MHIINVRNVCEALPLGLHYLWRQGKPTPSRNGPTLEAPGVVMTVYQRPTERFMLDPQRDCNPFFHFIEGLWVIAGDNRAGPLALFNKRMAEYSDNGSTLNGAYGYRARFWFGVDQFQKVRQMLINDPGSRQAVVGLWDPAKDLTVDSKDKPCNDLIVFRVRGGALDMTVYNRSNDVIWGAYGANAVHFSMLQEWMAASLALPVGTYTQVSNSYHVYTELELWQKYIAGHWHPTEHVVNPYDLETHAPAPTGLFPTAQDAMLAQEEAVGFFNILGQGLPLEATVTGAYASSLQSVAMADICRPLVLAWVNHKHGAREAAIQSANRIAAPDLRNACLQWLDRRYSKVTK